MVLSLPAPPTGAVRVDVPPGALVVLAGLPGAGKTTLLRRLAGRPGVRALDAEDVAAPLRRTAVPYRALRPAVHLLHLLRVVAALPAPGGVLTTDPLTSPLRRALLRAVARLTGRELRVVLVDATEAQARDGQARRDRRLGERRMRRHLRRYRRLVAALGPQDRVLTRAQAARAR